MTKIGEEQLFYLMQPRPVRGAGTAMVVSGFIEPMVKELPMEYAVEMNRLDPAADGRLGRVEQ